MGVGSTPFYSAVTTTPRRQIKLPPSLPDCLVCLFKFSCLFLSHFYFFFSLSTFHFQSASSRLLTSPVVDNLQLPTDHPTWDNNNNNRRVVVYFGCLLSSSRHSIVYLPFNISPLSYSVARLFFPIRFRRWVIDHGRTRQSTYKDSRGHVLRAQEPGRTMDARWPSVDPLRSVHFLTFTFALPQSYQKSCRLFWALPSLFFLKKERKK